MKTQEEYIADWRHCPFCNSNDIEAISKLGQASLVKCNCCERRWWDIYSLVGYKEVS